MSEAIVILGAGQAGAQLAHSLRREGFAGPITLVGDEFEPPYQRPPLSKTYLMGTFDAARLPLRADAFYTERDIDLRLGARAEAIDRTAKTVQLSDGDALKYETLILATGTRVRVPPIPGVESSRVFSLRSVAHSEAIKTALETAQNVVVIGGGFIGLETASAANTMGKSVVVIEAVDRLMQRAVGAPVSKFFHDLHAQNGVELIYSARVAEISDDGNQSRVQLEDGRAYPADLIILGAGVIPNQEIAETCGLACSNGIDVDVFCQTSDPDIYAIGDISNHPSALSGRQLRLESVQNATDQARALAKTLTGNRTRYEVVPWFWSDQYDVKLQMAGLSEGHDAFVIRGEENSRSFSLFYFRSGRLLAVDSINAPADHMAARKILAKDDPGLSPEQAGDSDFDLKTAMR